MIPAKALMVAAANLNARFRYKPDPKFNDRWTILRDDLAEGAGWRGAGFSVADSLGALSAQPIDSICRHIAPTVP